MPVPGEALENAAMGTRLRWQDTASSSGGQRVVAQLWMTPDALEAPPHVHPHQDEEIAVTAGQARVRVGRTVRVVGPSERVVIPAGTPHTFSNAGQVDLEVRNELRPALQWDDFCQRAWRLPADSRGRPNPLHMALLLQGYPDHLYLAGVPLVLQRALIALAATIARLAGVRLPP